MGWFCSYDASPIAALRHTTKPDLRFSREVPKSEARKEARLRHADAIAEQAERLSVLLDEVQRFGPLCWDHQREYTLVTSPDSPYWVKIQAQGRWVVSNIPWDQPPGRRPRKRRGRKRGRRQR